MDLRQVAKFFDLLDFDVYSFTLNVWISKAFKGQLKRADNFISIYNRPTRKRMIYTANGKIAGRFVIRPSVDPTTVFMVGASQKDIHQNVKYREVTGVHIAKGPAVVRRLTPQESSGKSIWATNETVLQSFADVEIRSVDESQETRIDNYGHFFLVMPSNTALERQDTVELDDVVYTVLETYKDGGLTFARTVNTPEERKNFYYYVHQGTTYDPLTQETAVAFEEYQCTGKVTPTVNEETAFRDEREVIRIMLHDRFISFVPKVQDEVVFSGYRYQISKIQRNSQLLEWYMLAVIKGED